MTTRQKILTAVFLTGAILGFGSGFAHLGAHCKHRREGFHQRIARTCAEAALQVQQDQANVQPDVQPDVRPGPEAHTTGQR